MSTILLGIDIGTTKLCAVALDAESGSRIAVESAANDASLPTDADGAEQDPRIVEGRTAELIRRLLARPKLAGATPVGIGVTGQMHGVLLVDRSDAPVAPLISWQDGRGLRLSAEPGRSYVEALRDRIRAGADDTGCEPATGYGAVTLLRLHESGAIPTDSRALTIHDFIVMRLCGEAVTDPSDAASWGIFDVRHGGRWLPAALAALPFLAEILPPVMETGAAAGRTRGGFAKAAGLPEGIPVGVAIGDNQASFLGSVPSAAQTLLLNLGTGGQMSVPIDHYEKLPALETRPLIPGLRLLVGASLCGGRAYQVLADFYAAIGRELFGCEAGADLYDRMNALAAKAADDAGGLSANALFAGSRTDPGARGSVSGIDVRNLTPANLTRALVAAMVDELVSMYARAEAAGARAVTAIGAGNAVRRNPVARQEIESRLGMPVGFPRHTEEAAMGAAVVGGVAARVYPDWSTALSRISEGEDH